MSENQIKAADFCGSLPIHHINSIQDYGYLIVFDLSLFNILQLSENFATLMGKTPAEVVKLNLADLISDASLRAIKQVTEEGYRDRVPLNIELKTQSGTQVFNVLLHIKAEYALLEMELADQKIPRSFTEVFREVRQFIAALESNKTVEEVCENAIREIRRISGFDGVRMYSFDADWNGTVIAEEITEGLEVYLGQTFPASDVPKQARALYIKNPFRLIPDRDYKPVRLYPVINPNSNAFVDLSDCNLRGIAPVHLEYMGNMNVVASMSIRVMRGQTLWGLISCHHLERNCPDVELRYIFEWLSMEISNRISAVLDFEELNETAALLDKRSLLTDNIYAKERILEGILDDENLNVLSLFSATGILVKLSGKLDYRGEVPEKQDLENLLLWLEGKEIEQLYSSHHLSDVYEEAKDFEAVASGILVIPIDGKNGDYVVCFRPELVRDINWGGDPSQTIKFEQNSERYHPRNSFKSWMETVYGQSQKWSDAELNIAESLRNFLFEFRTKQLYK